MTGGNMTGSISDISDFESNQARRGVYTWELTDPQCGIENGALKKKVDEGQGEDDSDRVQKAAIVQIDSHNRGSAKNRKIAYKQNTVTKWF
jgi:hypothetical protein